MLDCYFVQHFRMHAMKYQSTNGKSEWLKHIRLRKLASIMLVQYSSSRVETNYVSSRPTSLYMFVWLPKLCIWNWCPICPVKRILHHFTGSLVGVDYVRKSAQITVVISRVPNLSCTSSSRTRQSSSRLQTIVNRKRSPDTLSHLKHQTSATSGKLQSKAPSITSSGH